MRLNQLVSRCPALCATILVLCTPCPLLAASSTVSDCTTQSASNSIPAASIKVLSLNIGHGRNSAINQLLVSKKRTYRNLDKIAELLQTNAPDIVALQEADAVSRWSGKFDHVTYVAEQSGFPCVVHGIHSQSWISNYGTALLARVQPTESISVPFSPSWPSKQKGFVTASLNFLFENSAISFTFVSVHFDFMRARVRDGQVRELVSQLTEIDGPLILMGDFNSHWAEEDSHIRKLADALDLQAFSPERDDLGTYKHLTGKRLDWILISKDLEFEGYEVLPDIVSDHFAVFAEIRLRQPKSD